MPRPRVSPENQQLALEFAYMVTTSEDAAESYIARYGQKSIYAVLSMVHPDIIRTDSCNANRKGISNAEFLRVLAESCKFTKIRDRRAARRSEDPTGAGMCVFCNIRWRNPTITADLKHLRKHHKRLVKGYPSFAKTTFAGLTSVLNAVIAASSNGDSAERTSSSEPTCYASHSSLAISCGSPTSDYAAATPSLKQLQQQVAAPSTCTPTAPLTFAHATITSVASARLEETPGSDMQDEIARRIFKTVTDNIHTHAPTEINLLAGHSSLAQHNSLKTTEVHEDMVNDGWSAWLDDGDPDVTRKSCLTTDSDFGGEIVSPQRQDPQSQDFLGFTLHMRSTRLYD
jgi:hypothetical protein